MIDHPTVTHLRNIRIPVRDGTRLAADLFVPTALVQHILDATTGALPDPVPVILEYLPYRKDDNSSARWDSHYYFAERGYVGVRLDVRGTGDSPGTIVDEYTVQEQLDGYDAIEWLAGQSWCNGRVGMWGTSYGGFNTIQVAMHNPPSLKAIIPHAATDDRYSDDVHFHGSCLAGSSYVAYPLNMVAMNAVPPIRALVGDEFESIWQEHLTGEPWLLDWLRHQTNDESLRQGSLRPNYQAIRCPVFHIAAWNDGYTNAVFRMLERLEVPNKALIGPWTHRRPNVSVVGPNIDFLAEMLRWWDYWLRSIENGVMDEPPITMYAQDHVPPERFPRHIPGNWRYETAWPPARAEWRTLYLGQASLTTEIPEAAGQRTFVYDPTVGTCGGAWCPIEPGGGLALDQRDDDARSVTFDSDPLSEPIEVLGFPSLTLYAASTAPVAFFVAKLCDVAPDGTSLLISRGLLNATRRASETEPEPLTPGEIVPLEIELKVASWLVPAGHRVRLSITSSDWPMIWPSPYPATNTIKFGPNHPSQLRIPTVGPADPALPTPQLAAPYVPPPTASHTPGGSRRELTTDSATGELVMTSGGSGTTRPIGTDLSLWSSSAITFRVNPADPAKVSLTGDQRFTLDQGTDLSEIVVLGSLASTVDTFTLDISLTITHNGAPYHQRTWHETYPRKLL